MTRYLDPNKPYPFKIFGQAGGFGRLGIGYGQMTKRLLDPWDAHGCCEMLLKDFLKYVLPLLDSRGYLAIKRHDCQSGLFGV